MKSEQRKFYDNRYFVMRRALHKLRNMLVLFYDQRLIRTMLGNPEEKSVNNILEVGCGQGTDVILVSKYARHVVAVDVSSKAIGVATALSRMKTVSEKVSFIVGDAEHLPLRNDLFDIVFCKDLLHHVSNSYHAASEMRRAVRKNGNVIALEANGYNPQMILIGLIYFSVDRGVFKNTKARLIAIFTGAGLSNVRAAETEFLPRHVLFEYRSPMSMLSVSNLKFILRTMYAIENTLQKSSILRRFANYVIVQGVKEI